MRAVKNKDKMSEQLVAKRRVFDLEAFEKKTVEVKYDKPEEFVVETVTPEQKDEQGNVIAPPVLAAPKALEFINNLTPGQLNALVNKMRSREAMNVAKKSISGASPKLVNQMVNVFRMLPPYSDLLEKDSSGDVTKESRGQQTQAIYAFIKSQPTILEGLKKQAAAAEVDEEEEENDEE